MERRKFAISVLKNKRRDSKAEFVNIVNQIYIETLGFLSRLSNRYQRLIARDIIELASKVLDNCEEAQAIFPKDEVRKELRYRHLLEARAALMALDVHMSHVYELMMKNPQGCFMDSKGNSLPPAEAEKRLEKMAQSLGEKIDSENNLIQKVIASDKDR